MKPSFGVIGLAVMGQNLALNVASKGYPVAVYNRTADRTKAFAERTQGRQVVPAYTPVSYTHLTLPTNREV